MTEDQRKTETVAFMLESLNSENRAICLQNGMPEDEIDRNIEQSQQSLNYMLNNIYDKMKAANLIG
jgi:hypothetical protein